MRVGPAALRIERRFGLALLALVTACAHKPAAPGPGEVVTLVAGGGDGADGGPAVGAKLVEPFGVARGKGGELFIIEATGNRLRRVDAAGNIHVAAGTGEKGDGGDDGPGPAAKLNTPHHIEFLPRTGLLYVADTQNNRVRLYDPATGTIRAFAGTGQKSFSGDGGPAVSATAAGVFCLSIDKAGTQLYFIDLSNRRVRVVDLGTGLVKTVAGNGEKGVPADGADALSAPLFDPRAVAVDSQGNVYVLERGGHALRVVDKAGKIRTVAGTGEKGHAGDGGPARAALMNGPKHLTVDRDDSVLIVDTENHVIRRYDPKSGLMTRVMGTGKAGGAGVGGPALAVELNRPHGVFVDDDGALLISDSENHRILRLARPAPPVPAR